MPEHALITGAGSGIGRAIAETLAGRGWRVTATDSRADSLAGLTDAGIGLAAEMDVTDAAAVRAVADQAGPVDLLVNSAGVGLCAPVEYCSADEVTRIFETNYRGPLHTMQAVLPSMRQRGHGTIVNVTSKSGHTPMVLTGVYSSLKLGLDQLSETLSYELAGTGVRVIILEPGSTATGFGTRRHQVDNPAGYEKVLAGWSEYVKRRAGQAFSAQDVADALLAALDSPAPPLRVDGSRDVTDTIALRERLGADGWRAHVLSELGLAGH
jgi:NADP-dependent 3-hydroxy acid dehydrogenase YdfG